MESLPLVDEHTVVVAAAPGATWEAARARLDVPLRGVAGRYARLVGVRSDRRRLYRLLVIDSRAHAVITKGMLRRIGRTAEG